MTNGQDKTQDELLARLARIATIHEFVEREFGKTTVPASIGTVCKSAAELAANSLGGAEYPQIVKGIGNLFILLIRLCGDLGVDPLKLIDDEFADNKKNLETQRAIMKAMNDELERRKNAGVAG